MSQDDALAYPTPKRSKHQKSPQKRSRDEVTEDTPTKKVKKSKKSKHSSTDDVVITSSNDQSAPSRQLDGPSAFYRERVSFYVTLSPVAYSNSLKGAIAEHISPLLLTYFPPLDGVVLAFENASLSARPESNTTTVPSTELLGQSIDEYAVTYIWLNADILIFRPLPGAGLEGVVNLQNQSMLGLLCYNYFNASIQSTQLPGDWKWTQADGTKSSSSGHYTNGTGEQVEGRVIFKVTDFEVAISDGGAGTITIFGTMQD